MKIKFKLSLLVIAIMAVVVTGISAIILREASDISMNLSLRGISFLTEQRAEYWKGKMDGRLLVLHTLADIMGNYENIPADERRDRFDDMLQATISLQPDIINLYTIWKPDAVDGMDARSLGRTGSDPQTGQYAITFTRENGQISSRVSMDIEGSMAHISGPNARQDRVEHPFYRDVNGTGSFLIRMMVPIINAYTNEVVGGVGCLFEIGMIQDGLEYTVANTEEIAIMVIYSGNGFILAHFLPDRIGRMLVDVDKEYGEHIQEAFQAVLSGNPFTGSAYDPTLDTNIELNMVPFEIGSSGTTWSIMIGTTEAYVLAEVHDITRFTVILAAIAIIVAAGLIFALLTMVTRPMVKVTETLRDISEGEGDLTRTIPEKGNDEVAELSRYFNKTLEKIRNLVLTIKQQSIHLLDIGNELSANMTETASAANQITANIQGIRGRVINQSASVTQTGVTMEQITVNIGKLNKHVERQTSSVTQSSSAIEQMLANIQSVIQTLVKNGQNVKELSSASEAGRAGLQNMAQDIQEIARQSEGLLEINSVMQRIASQTNLLSMNAAIEAAHAGDAGMGFAVVADEIRKLAEDSGTQSKIISSALKKIKASIDKIMESSAVVLARFETIDTDVKTVSEQAENIRGAMEEQGQGSKQILDAVELLNELTQRVKDESVEMLGGSREVIQESKNLEQVTQEITGGMNEMAVGAEQINAAVHRVSDISGKNRENINILVKEVARFKVD